MLSLFQQSFITPMFIIIFFFIICLMAQINPVKVFVLQEHMPNYKVQMIFPFYMDVSTSFNL